MSNDSVTRRENNLEEHDTISDLIGRVGEMPKLVYEQKDYEALKPDKSKAIQLVSCTRCGQRDGHACPNCGFNHWCQKCKIVGRHKCPDPVTAADRPIKPAREDFEKEILKQELRDEKKKYKTLEKQFMKELDQIKQDHYEKIMAITKMYQDQRDEYKSKFDELAERFDSEIDERDEENKRTTMEKNELKKTLQSLQEDFKLLNKARNDIDMADLPSMAEAAAELEANQTLADQIKAQKQAELPLKPPKLVRQKRGIARKPKAKAVASD